MATAVLMITLIQSPRYTFCDEQKEILCQTCGRWLPLSPLDGGVGDEISSIVAKQHIALCEGDYDQTSRSVYNWLNAETKN